MVYRQAEILIEATITAYQQTELEIVRTAARSATMYIEDQIEDHGEDNAAEFEQEMLTRFIAPIHLLENGDAWVYAPDHVVFDLSADFPDQYRGKSIAQIFALQKEYGAAHYQEMTDAVMNAREGTGWYIWLPDKGREIAAWTPVHTGKYVWIIGISTPLPEILDSTGAAAQIESAQMIMALFTLIGLGLTAVFWIIIVRQVHTRELLRKSEEHYHHLFDMLPYGAELVNLQGYILDCNPRTAHMLGYERDELLGKHLTTLFDEKSAAIFYQRIPDIIAGRVVQADIRMICKDGNTIDVIRTGRPLYDTAGEVSGLLSVNMDITARMRAEEALQTAYDELERRVEERTAALAKANESLRMEVIEREQVQEDLYRSEERYRSLFESIPIGLFRTTPQGEIIESNPALIEMLGYADRESLLKCNVLDLYVARTDRRQVQTQIERNGIVRGADIQLRRRDGECIWGRETAHIVQDVNGQIYYEGSLEDITERQKAREVLLKSEEKYRLLTESMQDVVIQISLEGYLLYVSPAIKAFADYDSEDEIGNHMSKYFEKEADLKRAITLLAKISVTRQSGIFEFLFKPKYKKPFPVEHTYTPILKGDEVISVQLVMRDITERKRAEAALRESESLYHSLVENLPQNVFRKDVDGRFTFANQNFCQTQGKALEELIGKTDSDIYPPELVRKYLADDAYVMATGKTFETVEVHRPLGKQDSYVQLIKVPIYDAAGRMAGVQGMFSDITKQVQAEKDLQARTRELALLNSAGQVFTSSLEMDQVVTAVLDQASQIIGIVACSIWIVDHKRGDLVCYAASSPDKDIVRGWRLDQDQGFVGWVFRHKKSLNVPNIHIDARRFKEVDQETGLYFGSILGVPLQTQSGVLGVLQLLDKAEDRFTANDVRLAESLGTLAAIAIENARLYRQIRQDATAKTLLLDEVNHRVKNNLAAIMGILYIEQRHARQSPQQRTHAVVMADLLSRIKGLSTVHKLLSASSWSPLPLSRLAGQVIESALQALPPDKQVLVTIDVGTPVTVMPKEAHNLAIIINELTTNVIKYAAPTKEISHITVRIDLDREEERIRFEFQDDGPGFPETILRLDGRHVGMYLIENTVRHTLRGEIIFHNNDGAMVTIEFMREKY